MCVCEEIFLNKAILFLVIIQLLNVFRCVRMYKIMDDYIFEKGRDT